MKSCEGRVGRGFVIRLEDGDVLPGCIERFAEGAGISVGHVILVGGIGDGEIVVGPRRSVEIPPQPMLLPVDGAHEAAAVGVLAPDADGKPILHIHGALGRSGKNWWKSSRDAPGCPNFSRTGGRRNPVISAHS